MTQPSTSTFTDHCLACHTLFTTSWQSRTGYCSSSCILAREVIQSEEYLCPRYQGNQVRFIIQTRQRPIPDADGTEEWIAFTDTPADLVRPVLGVYEGPGQFAGAGSTEADAVLDLIAEIEAKS